MSEIAKTIRKLRTMNQRGSVRRSSYGHQQRYLQIQLEAGEPVDDIEHFEPFGFTSGPMPGAEAVVLAFNGNGSHSVALVVDDRRYKLEVSKGEVAIFNRHGDKVHIKDDRTIEVKAATKVIVDTPETLFTGIVKGVDFITYRGVKLDSHDHDESIGTKTARPNV